MAELGTTSDPRVLIPGEPGAIAENARVLRARSEQALLTGEGLLMIDSGAWTGPAASMFRDKFSYEPAKWLAAADSLETASRAVDDYATMLRTAQARAVDAINAWNEGEDSRDKARDILNRARASLATSGDSAARTLSRCTESAPAKSDWLDALTDYLGTVAASTINGAASLGNSLIHHPLAVGAATGGLALAAVSGLGFGGGTVLDATGVGSVVGVPTQVASAAGITTGLGVAGAATTEIIDGALGEDQVEVIDESSFENTKHGDEQLLERGFTDEDIANTKSVTPIKQGDGADVYIKKNPNGRYDIIVEGDRGIITAIKGVRESKLNKLGRNYQWEGF